MNEMHLNPQPAFAMCDDGVGLDKSAQLDYFFEPSHHRTASPVDFLRDRRCGTCLHLLRGAAISLTLVDRGISLSISIGELESVVQYLAQVVF